MRKYADDLVKSLCSLYNIYDNYINRNCDSRLNVLLQDNTIYFKLYNNNELVDEFTINFNDKERDIYTYISVMLLRILFNSSLFYKGENIICNKIDDANVRLEINDDNILDIMLVMISKYGVNINDYGTDNIEILRRNLSWRLYPRRFMNDLNERINLSRKLLRMDGIE